MRKILTPVLTPVTAAIVAVATLVGSACASSADTQQNAQQINVNSDIPSVVVTTSILGDIVNSALGDLVGAALTVETIVPAGADAHDFAPSAKQAETMENADLLVVNGLGYEEAMTDLIINAMDSGAIAFPVAGRLEPEASADPHVWLDPVLIADTFAELPRIASETLGVPIGDVQVNVDRYLSELEALDATIRSDLSVIGPAQRKLVTNHDSLGRFADRYDLTVVDTIIPSVSTSAEASAADLDGVLDIIRSEGVRAIFSDSTGSSELAEALADELGSDVAVVELYTESLGEPGSGADTYIAMMTVNAERIAAASS